MKVKPSIFAAFAVGAVLASLPYTLSNGRTNAQGAGPAGLGGGQGGPPPVAGRGIPSQPGPGQLGGQFGGGMFRGGSMVNGMTAAGDFLFASSGDTIYKIRISTMKIEGETKLPQPRQFGPGGQIGGRPNAPGAGGSPIPPTK